VITGAFYEGLASQALVDHALDHQRVHGVVGWPAEEILYSYRTRQIQPARAVIECLLDAIGADASLDTLEQRMAHEPVLYYRFLRYMHSPSLGLRGEGGNLRQGLMALGYSHVRDWLAEQLPRASSDANLEPIRSAMVLRARTMEQLAQAGAEDALRREVFLCGLFSQVDVLLGEPLDATLGRIPLPERVGNAILTRTGPYAPWLDVASALESGSSHRVREVCAAHELSLADVNRALLRALAAQAS
jgi:c-di-GMP-related signal transduction protein